jgi:hypothetical protein
MEDWLSGGTERKKFRRETKTTRRKWYQKPAYLLLALAVVLSLAIVAAPTVPLGAASPDQSTFYSRDSDGHVEADGDNYSIVHGASWGTVHYDMQWLSVGQRMYASPGPVSDFYLWRGGLFFDTSSLPGDASISSAVLSLYGESEASFRDFEITVVDGWGLHEPLVPSDYGYLGSQNVSGGSFDTAGFSTSGYNDIPLNETGMGWISKTGITKFGLRSSKDIGDIAPTSWEYVDIYASEQGEGYQPRLVVTYTTAPPPPPVGGEAYPVNKAGVILPWAALGLAVIAGSLMALRQRRAQS